MKKLLVVIFAGLAVAAQGAMLQEGTQELSINGSLDFESADGTATELELGYGYFILDGLQVGVAASIADSDSARLYALGVGAEYNFDLGSQLVPFIGLSIGWGKGEIELGDSTLKDDAVVGAAEAGVKYFIVENVALELSYLFEKASEDIFFNDEKAEDTDNSLQLGLRFYF